MSRATICGRLDYCRASVPDAIGWRFTETPYNSTDAIEIIH
jgi:hypothetical protein